MRHRWRALFRIVTLAIIAMIAFASAPARAQWRQAESAKFVVYSDGSEKELRAFVENLEHYDALLRQMTATTRPVSPNKLQIYLVRGENVRSVDPYAGEHVAGYYLATPRAILVVANAGAEISDLASSQTLIFHEYAHHFVFQYFPGVYPAWFGEGFAEYYSTAKFDDHGVEIGRPMDVRSYTLVHEAWEPIESIFTPEANPPSSKDMYYAESWLATHYLLRTPERAPQLRKYLLALRDGEDAATAFTASFGMDFDAFGKALQDYANKGMTYTRLQWTPPPVGPITVTLLPASADRIVKLRARLLSDAVSSGDKAEFINKVRTEAASFPDDPLALRTLARAEVFYGDVQKADAALDHLLAIKPDDAEALYLKGVRTIHDVSTSPQDIQAIYAKARAFFAKAYRADPNNYQSLYLYAYTLLYGGAKPTQNTLNVIMAAHQLAPQVDEITYEAARALKAAGMEDEAVPLLRSIAYKPHPTWMSDAALNALYADGKQYDRAIRDYAAAIGRAPKDPRLYVNRGNVYASANHPDLALQDFAQARALSSKDAIALNNLCWAQATHGLALEAALKDCDAALAMDPKSSATFDSRGFVNLRLGQFAAAVADYTAALKSRPDVPTSLYGRALAERQLGQTEAAQKDLAAALTAAPDVASEFEAYGVK